MESNNKKNKIAGVLCGASEKTYIQGPKITVQRFLMSSPSPKAPSIKPSFSPMLDTMKSKTVSPRVGGDGKKSSTALLGI